MAEADVMDTVEVSVEDVTVVNDPSRTWDYMEGVYLLSDSVRDKFMSSVSQYQYGHLTLRKHLYHAFKADQRVKSHLSDLYNSLNHDRRVIDLETSTRNKNRKFLSSLSDEVLAQYCEKYNVSMASFLNNGDRLGLLEAIVDEMLI